jgi:valyl-tRNA synthetase
MSHCQKHSNILKAEKRSSNLFSLFIQEIFVHGFTLDEQGNKMSKSLGNVVDPRDIVEGSRAAKKPALGVDVLR